MRISLARTRRAYLEGQRHACTWTGFPADKFIGQRLHQFLNMAGRIYYETHIAPLLRMQGFFSEFALDFETAAGERLPVIANAAERRDPDGTVLFTAVVVIKATDRRRYERELVDSRSELRARDLPSSGRRRNCGSSSLPFWDMTCAIHSRRSARAPESCSAQAPCRLTRSFASST